VCGRPATQAPYQRIDTLRVCALEKCLFAARRRDNVAKQRRAVERRKAKRAAAEEVEQRPLPGPAPQRAGRAGSAPESQISVIVLFEAGCHGRLEG
jgi:hypothetical protein